MYHGIQPEYLPMLQKISNPEFKTKWFKTFLEEKMVKILTLLYIGSI